MSQQSEKLIDDMLEEADGSLDWDRVKSTLVGELDVMSMTARKYINDSEVAEVVVDDTGNRRVIRAEYASGDTVLADEEKLVQPVGKPTGDMFGNLSVLSEIDHPWIPRAHKTGYFRRQVTDRKTDVSVVTATMADDDYSTLLIGKHGVGKDKLVLHICANTNRPVIRPTFTSGAGDLVDLLIGHYTPDEDGGFTFRKGLLTIALENGYVFVADEINMVEGRIQTQMNDILEDADQAQLTIPETNEVIKPHPEFKFIGTMNPPTMEYGGTNELNAAFASRFFPIKLPELDTSSEKKVVAGETNWSVDDEELSILLDDDGIITAIRGLHESGKIRTWISTREVIKIGRMADTLGDTREATALILKGTVHPENEDAIESVVDDDTRWRNLP